jgi:hypothetical protein
MWRMWQVVDVCIDITFKRSGDVDHVRFTQAFGDQMALSTTSIIDNWLSNPDVDRVSVTFEDLHENKE